MSKKLHLYTGGDADVSWDARLCIHVSECGRASNDLFVGGRDPWCNPDTVPADEALEVVKRCPTGAITVARKDGGEVETPEPENQAVIANRGPIYLRGDLQIEGAADDMEGVKYRAALCRCGQSKNKPFCDNTHEEIAWDDRGAIGVSGPGLEETGGKLEVKPLENGPLRVTGNLVMISGGGVKTWRGKRVFLCRCGQSKTKPLCDGSHNKAGFVAD